MTLSGSSSVTGLVHTMCEELAELADEYDEFTDTEVREAIHLTLNHHFVWGTPVDELPVSFGMRTMRGDARIRVAIANLLKGVAPFISEVPVGAARLKILQDPSFRTRNGMRYDELFGHRDQPLPCKALPAHLFVVPKYE